MKNLLLTFAAFLVLLLIGCQENSITDPIQDTGLQKNDDPSVTTGTILLDGTLQDPHPIMNSYYVITGEIQYQHRIQYLDPIPPSPQYTVLVNLSASADLNYLCTVCSPPSDSASVGTISIKTSDNIYVSEEGIYLLEKTFPIQGGNHGMVLVCRFMVTTDGVGLNEMQLKLNDDNI